MTRPKTSFVGPRVGHLRGRRQSAAGGVGQPGVRMGAGTGPEGGRFGSRKGPERCQKGSGLVPVFQGACGCNILGEKELGI